MKKDDFDLLKRVAKTPIIFGSNATQACRAALAEMEQLRWERDVLAANLGVKDPPIFAAWHGNTVAAVIIREPQSATDTPLHLPERAKYG